MLSTIFSYLFDVPYNILIRHGYKFCFSRREAGVTPKLSKRAAREGRRWMRRRKADTDRPWNHSWKVLIFRVCLNEADSLLTIAKWSLADFAKWMFIRSRVPQLWYTLIILSGMGKGGVVFYRPIHPFL